MNIKGLTYKTVWVEFPDIEVVAKQIGVIPCYERGGIPLYTLPMIYDHNTDVAIADSWAIAKYLDNAYPETYQVIPRETAALQKSFQVMVEAKLQLGVFLYTMIQTCSQLKPQSREYYRRTREAALGKMMEEVAPQGSEAREQAWKGILTILAEVSLWMSENGEGVAFVCGKRAAFVDFVLGSHLTVLKRVLGPQSREYRELMCADGGRWAVLTDALARWEYVDRVGLVYST